MEQAAHALPAMVVASPAIEYLRLLAVPAHVRVFCFWGWWNWCETMYRSLQKVCKSLARGQKQKRTQPF
jgi:hypothetical protein